MRQNRQTSIIYYTIKLPHGLRKYEGFYVMIQANRLSVAYSSYDNLVLYRQSAIGNRIYVPHTAECRMPNAADSQ